MSDYVARYCAVNAFDNRAALANKFFAALLALWGGLYPTPVQANLVSPPMPLSEVINHSQTVVVAQVISFTADNEAVPDTAPPENQSSGNIVVDTDDNSVPSGQYSLHELKVFKGQSDKTLHLHLPALSRLAYGFANLKIKTGDYVILFLVKSPDGQLLPSEPGIPLVQLNGISASAIEAVAGDVTTNVLELMLRSLNDPAIRRSNTALLRDVNSPLIVQGLSPFINDPNDSVKDNVLYCMAVNQVVSVIPLISRLQTRLAKQGSGTYCVTALQDYTNPKAAPFLNPLLLEDDEYIRINSVLALQKIADTSSIPYLVLSLHDPDPQNLVPYTAYLTLHKIIPKLPKPVNDFDYTRPIPQKDLMPINSWWNDELMGVHFRAAGQAPGGSAGQVEDKVGQLNLETFNRDPSTRLRSVKLLASEANHTSLPFLVLALQDPDSNVAYSAYKILYHLVPALGPAKDATAFNVKRAAVSQPAYDWWRDELLGKHLSK